MEIIDYELDRIPGNRDNLDAPSLLVRKQAFRTNEVVCREAVWVCAGLRCAAAVDSSLGDEGGMRNDRSIEEGMFVVRRAVHESLLLEEASHRKESMGWDIDVEVIPAKLLPTEELLRLGA